MNDVDLALVLTRQRDETLTGTARLTLPESSAPATLAEHVPITLNRPRLIASSVDPAAYGRSLGAMLFADPHMAQALARGRDLARRAGARLRLRLSISPPDDALAAIRWETLRDPVDGAPLALGDQLLFARYLESADLEPVRPVAPGDLRALVVVAGPRNLAAYRLDPVDIEGEVVRSCAALAGLHPQIIARTQQRPATLAQIDQALRDSPHILYLVCHGGERDGESVLWLEGEDGMAVPTPAGALVELIARMRRRPLLVALSVCRSGGDLYAGGALAALGPQLARGGVAAVVAALGDLPQATAATMMPALFRNLLRTGRIDIAMAAARAAAPDGAWWVPTLYMRPQSGALWPVAGRLGRQSQAPDLYESYLRSLVAADAQAPSAALAACLRLGRGALSEALPEPARGPVGAGARRGATAREGAAGALEALLERHGRVALVGAPGAGKSALLHALARRLAERWRRPGAGERAPALPILVNLRDWHDPACSLGDFLQSALARYPALAEHLPDLLRAGQAVLLLDGLNELPRLGRDEDSGLIVDPRVAALAAIGHLPEWREARCVVGCHCDARLLGPAWAEVSMLPLSRAQVEAFAEASLQDRPGRAGRFVGGIFGGESQQQRGLQELVATPAGLELAMTYFRREDRLPEAPAELLQTLVERTLAAEVAGGRVEPDEMADLYRRLGRLAVAMIAGGLTQVDRTRAMVWTCGEGEGAGTTVTGRLWQVAQRVGLITLDGRALRFTTHLSRQYLAARHLAQSPLTAELLAQAAGSDFRAVWPMWRWLEPGLRARIAPLLGDPRPAVRRDALYGLRMLHDPTLAEAIAPALADPDPAVRHSAAVALADLGDQRATPQLSAGLSHPEPAVRRESALMLGRLRDRRAGPALADTLAGDEVGSVRVVAATALGLVAPAHAFYALVGALLDSHVEVRVAAAAALGALGDEAAVGPLCEALARDCLEVARAAAYSLALLGEPALAPLAGMLDRPGAAAARAALALGHMRAPEAAVPLLGALARADGQLRQHVLVALRELGERALLPLLEALQTGTAEQRSAAAEALGFIADRRTAPHLLAALDDPDEHVRERAAVALGRFGRTVADALLDRALADGRAGGRSAAIALGELGDEGLRALAIVLRDPREAQRMCAAEGLARAARRAPAATRLRARRILDAARYDVAPAVRHVAAGFFAALEREVAPARRASGLS